MNEQSQKHEIYRFGYKNLQQVIYMYIVSSGFNWCPITRAFYHIFSLTGAVGSKQALMQEQNV